MNKQVEKYLKNVPIEKAIYDWHLANDIELDMDKFGVEYE